jgi:hypothetical protein
MLAKFKLIGASLLLASTSYAQQAPSQTQLRANAAIEGTVSVKPFRQSVDSKLQTCGFEFIQAKSDFATQKGGLVRMYGSFSFSKSPMSGAVYTLKLAVLDRPGMDDQTAAPIANAFIQSVKGVVPKNKPIRVPGESGFTLFVGALDLGVSDFLEALMADGKMNIGFNRQTGQQDVVATIDLSVEDINPLGGKWVRTRSKNTEVEFSGCMEMLLADILKEGQKSKK